MELDYNQPKTECPKYQCKGDKCECGLSYVVIPAVLGDDSEGSEVAPKNGAYCNTMVKYAANNNIYLYSSEGVPVLVDENLWPTLEEMQEDIDTLEEGLADEIEARTLADQAIEEEIEHLRNNPDVVDIVATYADLVAYDTSELGDKDVIRVLTDETHDDESTYYRWDKPNQEWEFIGAVEGYYTKDQTDVLLAGKQDTLTFDSTPTANSTNPVTSGGIKTYVDNSPAFKPFPASVTTDGTTQQLMSSILALSPEVGTAYLGTVDLSDMPSGLIQEEVEVYVYSDYVVYCIMRSTDVAPYAWWCASYNYQGWQPVNTDTTYTAGTNITIDANNEISATDTTYTAGTGLDLTGTEFSVDSTVVALQTDLPTNTSDLTNDGSDGTSTYVEADELATVATTGDYGDLLNTPTIPTVNDATLTIQKNSTDVGTFTANASSNSTINITVPTTAADVSALPASTKYGASISLTINSSTYVITAQLKDQDGNNLGSSQTIDLPLESVVVNGSYDSQTKKIILTLQNGNTIEFSVADLVSGLQETLIAGTNIQIAADGKTISATDTTYSNFTGTDGTTAGAAGLVPAPATTDADKFLKADGTWDTAGGGGPTVVQATGTSTTDVMSQNAVTRMVFADPSSVAPNSIRIGATSSSINGVAIGSGAKAADGGVAIGASATNATGYRGVAIGQYAKTSASHGAAFGTGSTANNDYSLALGEDSFAGTAYSVALGAGAKPTRISEVNIGMGTAYAGHGYNNSNYRILGGVYDPIDAHDAATKGYVDSRILSNAGAPTTATVGTVGQLLEDTTNGKLYICTAIVPGTDPDPDTYTWEEVGSGGGGGNPISAADWTALWAGTVENINGVGV